MGCKTRIRAATQIVSEYAVIRSQSTAGSKQGVQFPTTGLLWSRGEFTCPVSALSGTEPVGSPESFLRIQVLFVPRDRCELSVRPHSREPHDKHSPARDPE